MAVTDSMVRPLAFALIFIIEIPGVSEIGLSFNLQVMLTGTSPLTTMHCNPTVSPALAGSSPNVKGLIWGSTIIGFIQIKILIYKQVF